MNWKDFSMIEVKIVCLKCGHEEIGMGNNEPQHGSTFVCAQRDCYAFHQYCGSWQIPDEKDLDDYAKSLHARTKWLYSYLYGCQDREEQPDPNVVNDYIDSIEEPEVRTAFEGWKVPL